jgi:hypothetical protein
MQARNPVTISQKILYKMAFDRSAYQSVFADKYKVREFVTDRIGSQYLPKLLHVGRPGESIPWENLPEEFVMKCSHSSGGSVIIWQGAKKEDLPKKLDFYNWRRYLVHPEKIERAKIDSFFSKCLSRDYTNFAGFPEIAYSMIPPRLICEELLLDAFGKIPDDLKFWCIHGRVEMIQVDTSRFDNHSRKLLDRDWGKLATTLKQPSIEAEIPTPVNLREMIRLAEVLSRDVDFVRVDLYDLGSRIVFGEMTNYPGGGVEKFEPIDLDFHLGSLLKLSN